MKKIKNTNGITLIALVITIIVLLILAGVAIATLTGENGILTQAENAQEITEESKNEEQIELNNVNSYIIEESEGSAYKVSENPSKYYGAIVNNYGIDIDGDETNADWRIFHSDGQNIYLIAKDYIIYDKIPATRNGKKLNLGTRQRSVSITIDVLNDYVGSEDIKDSKLKNLNKEYFINKKYTSENPNMQFVAYMLDTTVWNSLKGYKAEYVIGGPTLELFADSYNSINTDRKIIVDASSEIGYQVAWSDGELGMYISEVTDNEELYITNSSSNATNMWLATPSNYGSGCIMNVNEGKNLSFNAYGGTTNGGFRPVVCLQSGTKLIEQEDGTYNIE